MNNEYLIRLFRRLNPWLEFFESEAVDLDAEINDRADTEARLSENVHTRLVSPQQRKGDSPEEGKRETSTNSRR